MNISIQTIVNQALTRGYLTAELELLVNQAYDNCTSVRVEDYLALDQLMEAMLTGQVLLTQQQSHINVMEKLVVDVILSHLEALEPEQASTLDVGDIAAYALNRLPPLYATSNVGHSFQQAYAKEHLQPFIVQQVEKAVAQLLIQPADESCERQTLHRVPLRGKSSLLEQITALLKLQAPKLLPCSVQA